MRNQLLIETILSSSLLQFLNMYWNQNMYWMSSDYNVVHCSSYISALICAQNSTLKNHFICSLFISFCHFTKNSQNMNKMESQLERRPWNWRVLFKLFEIREPKYAYVESCRISLLLPWEMTRFHFIFAFDMWI